MERSRTRPPEATRPPPTPRPAPKRAPPRRPVPVRPSRRPNEDRRRGVTPGRRAAGGRCGRRCSRPQRRRPPAAARAPRQAGLLPPYRARCPVSGPGPRRRRARVERIRRIDLRPERARSHTRKQGPGGPTGTSRPCKCVSACVRACVYVRGVRVALGSLPFANPMAWMDDLLHLRHLLLAL